MLLENKVILITGASSGIGKAIALQLSGKGNTLLLAARRKEELEEAKNDCLAAGAAKVICYYADMGDPESVAQLSKQISDQFPVLDVLVNNAGISQRSLAEETLIEVDRRIMEVNFFGKVLLTKLLWPKLLAAPEAQIVLISSVTGTFGFPQRSAYAASKHALEGFFESWYLENKHPSIHFTTVAPGRIRTDISFSALRSDGSRHSQMDDGQLKGIPVQICAQKIIRGMEKNKRKIYILQQEGILVWLHNVCNPLFFWLVKKLKLS